MHFCHCNQAGRCTSKINIKPAPLCPHSLVQSPSSLVWTCITTPWLVSYFQSCPSLIWYSQSSWKNLSKSQSEHVIILLKILYWLSSPPEKFKHFIMACLTQVILCYFPPHSWCSWHLDLLSGPGSSQPQGICWPLPGMFFPLFLRWLDPTPLSSLNWMSTERKLLVWHGTLFLSQCITIRDYFIYLSVYCLPPTLSPNRQCTS